MIVNYNIFKLLGELLSWGASVLNPPLALAFVSVQYLEKVNVSLAVVLTYAKGNSTAIEVVFRVVI